MKRLAGTFGLMLVAVVVIGGLSRLLDLEPWTNGYWVGIATMLIIGRREGLFG